MSAQHPLSRQVARALLAHAARVSPAGRRGWFVAMASELDHLPHGASVLQWALGCLLVAYTERIMDRSLTHLPRWLLATEMAVCLVPLTWLFVAVIMVTAQGHMTLVWGLKYASAALVGPLGLALAARILFVRSRALGRAAATLLALLAAWTFIAELGQSLDTGLPVSTWWRDFVLIAVLPAVAVSHLLWINADRRARALVAH